MNIEVPFQGEYHFNIIDEAWISKKNVKIGPKMRFNFLEIFSFLAKFARHDILCWLIISQTGHILACKLRRFVNLPVLIKILLFSPCSDWTHWTIHVTLPNPTRTKHTGPLPLCQRNSKNQCVWRSIVVRELHNPHRRPPCNHDTHTFTEVVWLPAILLWQHYTVLCLSILMNHQSKHVTILKQ